jgi:aconitate hydratase 2/2-methylisocitrate dehydratase
MVAAYSALSSKLNQAPVAEYLQSNIALLSSMIEMDYEDKKTIARRIQAMQKWLDAPELLTADDNAEWKLRWHYL